MIEKIKKHFKNLNNIQKVLYLIIVLFIIVGELLLEEFGIGYRSDRENFLVAIYVVSVLGIFLFKDKSEKDK